MKGGILELVFVFFSKIYIFFYKEKGGYWKIFPILIMSTIVMINLQLIISFFFSVSKPFIFVLATVVLLVFIFLHMKKEYDSVVQYSISKKQKIMIISILLIDFVIVGVLTEISRNIYMDAHRIVK